MFSRKQSQNFGIFGWSPEVKTLLMARVTNISLLLTLNILTSSREEVIRFNKMITAKEEIL